MTDINPSLLQTIQGDAALRERLAEMPPDSQTVSLTDSANPASFAHPGWNPRSDGDESETVLLPATPPSSTPALTSGVTSGFIDEGFVPQRKVATLNEGKATGAEYRLVGKLGSGGTGVVYQAHQRAIDREVAVKSLRSELAADPHSRERFLAEARVIGGLDHPNVIALHELCMDETGGLFYSMKRVDGASWDQRIDSMSMKDNFRVLFRVADAIRYAHSRGLVHRDIKPENVMLGQFGEVLLADWGLALNRHPGKQHMSQSDSTIGGTPAYMAPELAMGDSSLVTFETDVYLLGAVLFQILTGYPPHHGETLLACIHAASNNVIRPTDESGEWMDIAMQAMATDPSDRFESVDAMIVAMEEQQVHMQSVRLVARAERIVQEASIDDHYEPFRLADAVLREAIKAWPGNRRAHEAVADLQRNFASVAASNGDLDLAISLYDLCGEGTSEVAMRIRRARDKRDEHARGEAKYSVLFTRSPEAGLLTRLSDGEVLEANDGFTELLGYAAGDVVGSRMPELNVWKCMNKRNEFVRDALETGHVDNFEAEMLHQDGHSIHVLISARSTVLNDERVLVSTLRDISLRKQAETELTRNRQRLRDLQRLAGLGSWSYDVRTGTIEWSDEVYRLVDHPKGTPPPEFETYLQSVHPYDRESLRQVVETSIKKGAAYELTIRQGLVSDVLKNVPEADRNHRNVIARGQPIMDDDGKVVELYGVLIPTMAHAASSLDAPPNL